MANKVGIEITIDEKGAITSLKKLGKEGEDATRKLEDGAEKANKSLINLRNLGLTISIAGIIKLTKEIGELGDEYSLLSSQIKLVIDRGKDLASVESLLLKTANETRQSYSSTVKLYTRLDRATEQLGITDKEVIKVTETLNKAIIVSGANAQEAEASIIQLSQGLASGTLRGDELRSVLEQLPRVAKLIADGMGVSIGALRELGTAGSLTTEQIVKAVQSQTSAIEEEFKKVEATSGQVWTQMKNNLNEYVTELSIVKSAQSAFNNVITELSEKLSEKLSESNSKNQLERAKDISFGNRTLEQQKMIIEELKKKVSEYDKLTGSQAENALNSYLMQLDVAEKRLDILTAQNKKEIELAENVKKANEEEVKREENRRLSGGLAQIEAQLDAKNELVNLALQYELEQYNKSLEEKKYLDQLAYDEWTQIEEKKILEQKQRDQLDLENKKKLIRQEYLARVNSNLMIADASNGLLKELFGETKAFTIADIGLSTSRGIMSALAMTPPNLPLSGIIGATGIVQAGKAISSKYQDGGIIGGDGTNRSDSIPILVSNGESILNSVATNNLGERGVNALNSGGSLGSNFNITVNAGTGSDGNAIAQMVANAIRDIQRNNIEAEPVV